MPSYDMVWVACVRCGATIYASDGKHAEGLPDVVTEHNIKCRPDWRHWWPRTHLPEWSFIIYMLGMLVGLAIGAFLT